MGKAERRAAELLLAGAHPIELEPDAAIEAFVMFDEAVDDCRLAYIVEMDHFIHEKYAFRLLVMRYLASRGWTWFGEELGWTDGVRIDRYLQSGDERHLDQVATYGYEGGKRTDRDDSAAGGIFDNSPRPQPADALTAEQRRFARDTRRLLPGARWFAVDVDYEPGIGYEELRALVDDDLWARLDRVPGESRGQEADRLRAVRSGLTAAASPELAHALDVLIDSLAYTAVAHPATTFEALRPAMAIRERRIAANACHVLDEVAPGEKVALMAGSLHLMKDDTGVDAAGVGAGPGGDTENSFGHQLAARDGREQVWAVWLLHGAGGSANPWLAHPGTLAPARGSVDAALAAALDTPALMRVPSDIDQPIAVTQMHNQVVRCDVAVQADAIVFAPRVTPLTN